MLKTKKVSWPTLAAQVTRFPAYVTISFVIVSVLLVFYSWPAFILTLSFLFAYLYFGRKFSHTYINSGFLLFITTLFTHTAVLGLLVIIFSAATNLSLHIVLCLNLLLFCLLFGYEALRGPNKPLVKRRLVTGPDALSGVAAIIAFFLLAIVPLINLSAQKDHSSTLALITGNVDYGTHLSIFNDYLGFGTVRTWGNPHVARSIAGGFYPSSWHAANAAIANAAIPSLRPGALSALVFGFINVFWISVLVFLSTRLAFTLYAAITNERQKTFAAYFAMVALALATFYFFDIHIMRFGFFSFTPQLIAILFIVYSLHQLVSEGIGPKSALGLAVLYCSISLAAWILLLPVAVGAVVIAAVIILRRKRQDGSDISRDLQANWPLYLIAIMSALAQFWLILTVKSASTVSLQQGIMMNGGAPVYDTWVYALLFSGMVAAILYTRRTNNNSAQYEPVLISVVSTLLFAGLIFAYQIYHTSTTHYYYFKSLMLIPDLLAPLCIAMVGIMLSRLKDTALAVMLAVVIPVALIQLIPNDPTMAAFIRGSRTVSSGVNSDIWVEMHKNIYPTNRVTIYFVNSGTNETSTIATLLVQANRPHSQCFSTLNNDITFMSLDGALKKLTSTPLPSACHGYNVVLKVDQSYVDLIRHTSTGSSAKIEFIHE